MATTLPNSGKSGRYGDLKRRLFFLLGALVVFRIGAHIPVPGIDPSVLADLFRGQQGGILGMFNMFSGGALRRFTIFALGIMPYISASIIMQLMSSVSPQLEALRKEGESGRRKITQYTRYGTVFLALFQATGISIALESQPGLVLDPGLMFRVTAVTTTSPAATESSKTSTPTISAMRSNNRLGTWRPRSCCSRISLLPWARRWEGQQSGPSPRRR